MSKIEHGRINQDPVVQFFFSARKHSFSIRIHLNIHQIDQAYKFTRQKIVAYAYDSYMALELKKKT